MAGENKILDRQLALRYVDTGSFQTIDGFKAFIGTGIRVDEVLFIGNNTDKNGAIVFLNVNNDLSSQSSLKIEAYSGSLLFRNADQTGSLGLLISQSNTAIRNVIFPDKSGTVAFLDDVSGGGTGLELITEGGNNGWRLVGRDSASYGNIGSGSVDFSYSNGASTTRGALGLGGMTVGLNTATDGDSVYAFAGGTGTVVSGSYNFAFGNGLTIDAINSAAAFGDSNSISSISHYGFVVNLNNDLDSVGSFAAGFNNITYGDYSAVFGRANETNTAYEFVCGEASTIKSNRLFNVGIGEWDGSAADGLSVFRTGAVLAPGATNAVIDAASGSVLVTKTWSLGSGSLDTETGTTYTILPTDSGRTKLFTNDGTVSITVDSGSLNDVGESTQIDYHGSGSLTIITGSATLLINENRTAAADGQYSRIAIQKVSTTEYRVFGELGIA